MMIQLRNNSHSVLGKRYASEMTSQLECALTEFYRQECLRSLYKPQFTKPSVDAPVTTVTKRKRVTIASTPEIIGCADPLVDRRPIDVSPISQLEMLVIMSQRTFPVQS